MNVYSMSSLSMIPLVLKSREPNTLNFFKNRSCIDYIYNKVRITHCYIFLCTLYLFIFVFIYDLLVSQPIKKDFPLSYKCTSH